MNHVFHFGGGASSPDVQARDKAIVGGKGANLAEMAGIGLPVPPGFTISTEVCTAYNASDKTFDDDLRAGVANGVAHVEAATGRVFGGADNPLLVSVRSGARVSMPGMMDTVLNLGLNDATVVGLSIRSGDPRFAWDSYRRFIQMYSDVVLGLDHNRFEDALEALKEIHGLSSDSELRADQLRGLVGEYKAIVENQLGRPFPQDVHEQLWGAIGAVFDSWESDRAKVYRKLNDIPHDWGTAVNVQAMVFGNMGDTSATGVAFTRDPATGEKAYYGEWLVNAQGEDVVAGIRTPQYLTLAARERAGAKPLSMEEAMPAAYAELAAVFELLEKHYRRHAGHRVHRRAGQAVDAADPLGQAHCQGRAQDGGGHGRRRPDRRGDRDQAHRSDGARSASAHPTLDPKAQRDVLTKGLPGITGRGLRARSCSTPIPRKPAPSVVTPWILVRVETSPEDIHGMHAAKGILTARGGMTSHAAVVARGMGRPCVSGAVRRVDRHGQPHRENRQPRDQGGRCHHSRWLERRCHGRPRADGGAGTRWRFRHLDDLGRQAPPHEGAHQRRNAARLPGRTPVRC